MCAQQLDAHAPTPHNEDDTHVPLDSATASVCSARLGGPSQRATFGFAFLSLPTKRRATTAGMALRPQRDPWGGMGNSSPRRSEV
jgi:hypothetical protein